MPLKYYYLKKPQKELIKVISRLGLSDTVMDLGDILQPTKQQIWEAVLAYCPRLNLSVLYLCI